MPRYDAFVSYSHAEGREVAERLVAGVEKFAKPWWRVRSLRLFLDRNSLTADPGLWTSIERGLADARWLIVVTSPGAARSPWVEREIDWWLRHRSPERILLVVAAGSLVWDPEANDFDAAASDALPPRLLGALEEEPRWVSIPVGADGAEAVDRRDLQEAIVDVATPLRGLSKEKLVAVAEREHRRTMRWVRGAILVLSTLLLAAVVAGLVALHQRGAAVKAARLALSRQVAAASESAAATDLDTSMLLAVQAARLDWNSQTRAALFSADTASPALVRFLAAGGKVERLACSGDGRAVVAGLGDGQVLLWPRGRGRPKQIFVCPRRVASLAINRDGTVAAAADKAQGVLWRRGRGAERLPVPVGQHVDAVALSPSGKTVVYHGTSPVSGGPESITVAPVADLGAASVHAAPLDGLSYGFIAVPSDRRALFLTFTEWQWRDLRTWSAEQGSLIGVGAHDYAPTISADGRFVTWTNGGGEIPIWETAGSAGPDAGDLTVKAPVTNQKALALSPDGSTIAVAAADGIYVAPTVQQRSQTQIPAPLSEPATLSGQSPTLVGFFGSDSRLLSAAGDKIAIWRRGRLDRLARTAGVPLEYGCTECAPPPVAVSADGKEAAVVDGFGIGGFVQRLDGTGRRADLPPLENLGYSYGSPLWDSRGGFFAIPIWGGSDPPIDGRLPADVRAWPAEPGEDFDLTAGIATDGDSVTAVNRSGEVYVRDAASGEALDEYTVGPGAANEERWPTTPPSTTPVTSWR